MITSKAQEEKFVKPKIIFLKRGKKVHETHYPKNIPEAQNKFLKLRTNS